MHPRFEHLLNLRDGAPVDVAVRDHVAACAGCTGALRDAAALQAQLSTLPLAPSRPDGWSDVQRRLVARDRAVRTRRTVAIVAAAASIAVIAVAITWRAQEPAMPARDDAPPSLAQAGASLDRLQSESQALDALLAALGEAPAVERAGSAVPIDTIEAQVQWLDHQLSAGAVEPIEPASAEALWRERVELMNSLVQLRYVEATQRVAL
jgi:hypothetical protein